MSLKETKWQSIIFNSASPVAENEAESEFILALLILLLSPREHVWQKKSGGRKKRTRTLEENKKRDVNSVETTFYKTLKEIFPEKKY